jgi:hypothetical protein
MDALLHRQTKQEADRQQDHCNTGGGLFFGLVVYLLVDNSTRSDLPAATDTDPRDPETSPN